MHRERCQKLQSIKLMSCSVFSCIKDTYKNFFTILGKRITFFKYGFKIS